MSAPLDRLRDRLGGLSDDVGVLVGLGVSTAGLALLVTVDVLGLGTLASTALGMALGLVAGALLDRTATAGPEPEPVEAESEQRPAADGGRDGPPRGGRRYP
jgi:hypothetical protein